MFGRQIYKRSFRLGQNYWVYFGRGKPMLCRFIKVTTKGFNLLNLETNACVLRSHLYCLNFSNKLPPNLSDIMDKDLSFWVPEFLTAKAAKEEVIL